VENLINKYKVTSEEIQSNLWPDLFLSGNYKELAMHFAKYIAAFNEFKSQDISSQTQEQAKNKILSNINNKQIPLDLWLKNHQLTKEDLKQNIAIQAAYSHFLNTILKPDNYNKELNLRQIQLTKIAVNIAAFEEKDMAEEAYLCVTEDNDDFDTIMKRANKNSHKSVYFVQQLPEIIQQQLFSASKGELLKPIKHDNKYYLYHVADKVDPDMKNMEIKMIIEKQLIDQNITPLVEEYVKWLLPL